MTYVRTRSGADNIKRSLKKVERQVMSKVDMKEQVEKQVMS